MGIKLNSIFVENFKSYGDMTQIPAAGLSVFMGANSSGKSTALQALLAVKQTMECNSPDIDLLLSGKYVTLGDFEDAINEPAKGYFAFGISVVGDGRRESYEENCSTDIIWKFSQSSEKDLKLLQINLGIAQNKINLIYDREHLYHIWTNGKQTVLSVGINNLIPNKLFVRYNKRFNALFYDFLYELFMGMNVGKRTGFLEKNELVSLITLEKFYFTLLRKGADNADKNKNEKETENSFLLAKKINELIERYCSCQVEYYANFNNLPTEYKITILFSCIRGNDNITELENILDKYEKKLEAYQNAEPESRQMDSMEELAFSEIYRLGREEKDLGTRSDLISDVFMSYKEIISNVIAKIFYLGPIREKPQAVYNIGFETIPKYVGTTGAYFASVLSRENKVREYILPNNECEKMSLLDALDEWAIHLNVASQVKVEKRNSFGFSVSVLNTQEKKSDIVNVGIGTSQVLPVLITGLLSEEGEYLLFEQPELHLHPYSQSRLADFFISLVKKGRKVIVETHSEYFVLRMRYHILADNISDKDIVVNFFQNKAGTHVSQGILTGYGNLQYPGDFCDETQKLLNDLMNAALMKRK